MERHTMLMSQKTQYCRDVKSPQMGLRFNLILILYLEGFIIGRKAYSKKIYRKPQAKLK